MRALPAGPAMQNSLLNMLYRVCRICGLGRTTIICLTRSYTCLLSILFFFNFFSSCSFRCLARNYHGRMQEYEGHSLAM